MNSVSVIITTFNEEKTIDALLNSLSNQTLVPQEIVICDGGSTDSTWKKLERWKESSLVPIVLLQENGNISQGRNAAIRKSRLPLLAITDAGCVPENNWLEELVKKHDETGSPVIAGYYKGLPEDDFQEAVVPYVLVMPDRLHEAHFLPATRSMLIEKSIWKKYGGFDESLVVSEDYAFAKRLEAAGVKMSFAKNAVVGWQPRKNLSSFSSMIAKFAEFDITAGILRPKVVALLLRYALAIGVAAYAVLAREYFWLPLLGTGFILYVVWATAKNKKYVPHGWRWLPILQFAADIAVISGTVKGLISSLKVKK